MSFMFNGNNVGGIKQFYGVCLVFFSPQGQNPDEHTWQDFGFQERDKGRELEGVSERRVSAGTGPHAGGGALGRHSGWGPRGVPPGPGGLKGAGVQAGTSPEGTAKAGGGRGAVSGD